MRLDHEGGEDAELLTHFNASRESFSAYGNLNSGALCGRTE